jgi:hypothetical protein
MWFQIQKIDIAKVAPHKDLVNILIFKQISENLLLYFG